MISFLIGTIQEVLEQSIILLVGGVGYEVVLPTSLLQSVEVGQEFSVSTHHHIREDQQVLYGFSDLAERDLFRQFLSVNGVGPKSALAALSAAPRRELITAIQVEDHSVFQSVSGIGPKTAKRLVLELKSKIAWDDIPTSLQESTAPNSIRQDLLLALEQLGYQARVIQPVVAELDLQEMQLEQAIKEVLKRLN